MNETQHTSEKLEIAYDETIKLWVVFYSKDRIDHDYETGEELRPIMCDQIDIARCFTKEQAEFIASTPSLLKENQELKDKFNNEETTRISAEVAIEIVCEERDELKAENERLKIYLEQTQYQDHSNIKSINEELIKALEHARTYMREFGCTDEHVFLKIDNALNNAK
jgi:hypothetical protein